MALHQVLSIEEQPGMVELMSNYVARNAETVCGVCGLQVVGHGPESQALGHEYHQYSALAADKETVERAHQLTHEAYQVLNGARA